MFEVADVILRCKGTTKFWDMQIYCDFFEKMFKNVSFDETLSPLVLLTYPYRGSKRTY